VISYQFLFGSLSSGCWLAVNVFYSCVCSQMLRDRFKEFARDTESIGQERVAVVNEVCDRLISSGHSDAAVIAEWKDTINELWADLLEMIDTRTQMLAASYELFKFYNDCKELLERIRVGLL